MIAQLFNSLRDFGARLFADITTIVNGQRDS
jgi:hypothetical protein